MEFDVSRCNQVSTLEHKIKAKMYKSLYESSQKSSFIRLTGFPVGIVSGILTLAKRVGRIVETALKGVINCFGALCGVKSCNFLVGLGMLGRACYGLVIRLPFSLLSAVSGIFIKTFVIGIQPNSILHSYWMRHDPAEKKNATYISEQQSFQKLEQALAAHPNDVIIMRGIAHCHLKGQGTPPNLDEAIKYYGIAAFTLNDTESMKILGNIAKDKSSYLEWWACYTKAAEFEDKEALYQVGMVYLAMGGEKEKAKTYFQKAYQKGSLEAQAAYSIFYDGCGMPAIPLSQQSKISLQVSSDHTNARKMVELLKAQKF